MLTAVGHGSKYFATSFDIFQFSAKNLRVPFDEPLLLLRQHNRVVVVMRFCDFQMLLGTSAFGVQFGHIDAHTLFQFTILVAARCQPVRLHLSLA